MSRKRLKSPEKASDPRNLSRRSPRFNPLAGPSQLPLRASDPRNLSRRSPRFNPLARPSQLQLRASDPRHLPRRSLRFNPLTKPHQPQLQASDPRHLPRKSPRFNLLARPHQPQLQASDPRHLPRKSPRFNLLAGPQLQASDPRHLPRKSPRFNLLAGPHQPQLQNNKQKEDQGDQNTTIKKKLTKTKACAKSHECKKDQGAQITLEKKLTETKASEKLSLKCEKDQGAQIILKKNLTETKASEKLITSSKDADMNITSLPIELIIKIFSFLSQNELGPVARVCKTFNEYARCPTLWKKVDVKFSWFNGSQNEIALHFTKKLSSSVTHMKLDFGFYSWDWRRMLNFEQLCVSLKESCSNLHTLILHYALLSENLPSVINLCSEFFPNLKVLTFSKAVFGPNCRKRGHVGVSKIKILTVFQCGINGAPSYTFPKFPYLEKLNFTRTCVSDYWFLKNDDVFSLRQLEILHLGNTNVSYKVFRILRSHAVNLTELSLCFARLIDSDFCLNNSMFPLLKTICLRCCPFVTCEGIVSLVQSCESLENIYVDRNVAESYANHNFVAANISKLEIVKPIDSCDHFTDVDYLLD